MTVLLNEIKYSLLCNVKGSNHGAILKRNGICHLTCCSGEAISVRGRRGGVRAPRAVGGAAGGEPVRG